MKTEIKKRILDSIWGFAIGDALGVPYEFSKPRKLKKLRMIGHGTHDQLAGTWSDDTSFLLACLDSDQDIESLWTNYKSILDGKYSIDNKLFDIGLGSAEALRNKSRPLSYYLIGQDQSKGNGCLTRAIPYAVRELTQPNTLISNFGLMHEDICLTHRNYDSVHAVSLMVAYLIDLYEGRNLEDSNFIKIKGLTTDGFVRDSLTISLGIGLSCTSFDDGILKAINLGGDTDSHAAFVGSLAAIRFGVPDKWMKVLRGKEMIQSIIDKSVWLK